MRNEEHVDYRLHLGGNTFVTIKTPYRYVNLREFRDISAFDGPHQMQKCLSLKFGQWQHMIKKSYEIHFQLPVDIDTE